MALNPLTLSTTQGEYGRIFSAAIGGQTAGSRLYLASASRDGFWIVNGVLRGKTLSDGPTVIEIGEVMPSGERRITSFTLSGSFGSGGVSSITAAASTFLANVSQGALIAALADPYAGQGLGTTTYATFGTVPGQLALSGSTIVAGAAAAVAGGSYSIGVLASSGDGKQKLGSTLTFGAVAASVALSITGTPPMATVGSAYSFTPGVAGGTGTKTFALTGTPPSGLTFSASSGAISGTPTVAGTVPSLTITVSDASGSASLGAFAITVAAASAGTALSSLRSDTRTERASLVNAFAGRWPGYQGQAFVTDVLATSPADFQTKLSAVPKSDSQWHRIRLDSAAPAGTWIGTDIFIAGYASGESAIVVGHRYGSTFDRTVNGGGLLVESSDPANPVTVVGAAGSTAGSITVQGYRGLEIRNVRMARAAVASTGSSRDGTNCFTVTATSGRPEASVVRVLGCGFGLAFHPTETDIQRAPCAIVSTGFVTEQLDVIGCRFDGFQTGIKTGSTKFTRFLFNDFIRGIGDEIVPLKGNTTTYASGNSAWDEISDCWTAGNVYRAKAEHVKFLQEHADASQRGTSGDAAGYRLTSEFEAMDSARAVGGDQVSVPFTGNPVDGSSLTLASRADATGITYTFVASNPTGNQVVIGASTSATLGNLITAVNNNTPNGIANVFAASSTALAVVYNYDQWNTGVISRSTSPALTATVTGTPTRFAGGTSYQQNDDILEANGGIRQVAHNMLLGSTRGQGVTFYGAKSFAERINTFRASKIPPNATSAAAGFSASYDVQPSASSGRRTSGGIDQWYRDGILNVMFDNSVAGGAARTAAGAYPSGTDTNYLYIDNIEWIDWKAGATTGTRPQDKLSGPFTTDAQGRVAWQTPPETLTAQQFRQHLYGIMKLADPVARASRDCVDPASWPKTEAELYALGT